MAFTGNYLSSEPTPEEIEAQREPLLLEFGTPWCGYCQAAQPLIREALAGLEGVEHIKVEDGKGRPLGRAFRVKLWPTLVFLRDGRELARVVRPVSADTIREALDAIA